MCYGPAGVERAFIDVSGDCIALGAPPGEEGWRVDLADPTGSGPPRPAGLLRDRALATSANTMSVIRYGAIVRGHVMDPATGYPADRMVQVSVQARSGIEADVLSTAMLVAGRGFEGVREVVGRSARIGGRTEELRGKGDRTSPHAHLIPSAARDLLSWHMRKGRLVGPSSLRSSG